MACCLNIQVSLESGDYDILSNSVSSVKNSVDHGERGRMTVKVFVKFQNHRFPV